LLGRNRIVRQHETINRRWREKNVLYFLSVHDEGTHRTGRKVGLVCRIYMFQFDPSKDIRRNCGLHDST
jgi:hypothetical protein